ncbi:MAG: choice-of-anchor L domain-containing protein, partial [Bacteroidota bacterium]
MNNTYAEKYFAPGRRLTELSLSYGWKLLTATVILIAFATQTSAQPLTTTLSSNSQTLAQMLAGPGVTISNYTLNCAANGSGTFNNTSSNLGLNGGVVLSSGRVSNIPQAANVFASSQFTLTGDAQLSTLTGGTVYDPCVLEFDIVPQGPFLQFDYVFASEEYPEWVCSQYNDVFGFFITGPDPGGGHFTSKNIALIPSTTLPVAINTINPGGPGSNAGGGTCNGTNQSLAYTSLFENNLSPVNPNIVYDGMTKVLTASSPVVACQTYHLKIAIADVADRIYDSGVFLDAYSFTSGSVTVSATAQLNYAGYSSAYEGCVGGSFTLTLSQAQATDMNVPITITGTATNGTDYTTIPSTVVIPAGQLSVTINMDPLVDGITEAAETVTISIPDVCTGLASSSATLTIQDDVPANITAADSTLCAGQSTQLTASGGLTYSWTPATGLSNATIPNPIATPAVTTTYIATMVWGACIKTDSVTVYVSNPLITMSPLPGTSVCNGGTVQITANPSGGVSPYSFLWSNGAVTPDITVATGGTYVVTITDAYGCTSSLSQPVMISNLSMSGTTTNVFCMGGNNGAIDITVSGANAPFTYDWGGGITSQDRTNLLAGTYSVTVTNTVGCSVTASYTITQPASNLTTSATNTAVSCNGGSNASISLTAIGGVSPYTYIWSNGATTDDLSLLSAGSYSVTVTDLNGCTASRTINITQPSALTTSETHVDQNCFGQSIGSINLSVSGGVAPYSYAWSNGESTQDIDTLTAGSYSVTVADSNSCVVNRSITIAEPTAISATPTATNPSCFGSASGSISLSVSGGTAGYTYSWSNGAATQNISSLSIGTFTVTVSDANLCTGTATATLTQPVVLSASTTRTNVSCNGGSNGTITLTVAGGTSPYSFNWGGGITTQNRTSLIAGTYTVTVSDNNACTATASATITQPAALAINNVTTNVSCNAGSNGSINITVSGGVSPYTYNWGGGVTSEDRNSLAAGTYNVTATDSRSCTITSSINVTQPTALAFSETHNNVTCNGGNTGSINVTISGGTSPYTYNWNGGVTTQDRTSLTIGTYTLTTTDARGCTVSGSATITQPAIISIAPAVTDATCAPGNNGAIDITVTGGSSPYTFNWGGGITTEDRTALFAGTYTVTVTDNSSCTVARAISVSQIGIGMSLSPSVTNVTCFGENNGAINITVTGGNPPLSYNWTNGSITEDVTSLTAGNYAITVTDGLGCSAISGSVVTEPSAIDISLNKTDVRCFGESSGSILTTVSGGAGSYVYNWSNSSSAQNLINIPAGSYDLTVSDANACSASALAIIVGQPSTAVLLSSTSTNVSCNGGNNGGVTLTVSGGTPSYTFNWSNGSISQNLSSAVVGTYTVTATDANTCSSSLTATITQPGVALSVSLATSNLACNGVNTGSITTTPAGGTSGYTFDWGGGVTSQNRSSLAAGTYSVTVTDNNGCTTDASASITQPTAVNVTTASTNVTCTPGMNNGTITLTVTGGTGAYGFNWNGGITTQNRTGLVSGTYNVTVSDANLCTVSRSITITQPNPLTITLNSGTSVCVSPTGTATVVTNSSGTEPYNYLWSNGGTTKTVNGLAPGYISVVVTDAAGACAAVDSIYVGLSGNNTDATFSISGDFCGPGATVIYTHVGSNNTITHEWNFGDGTPSSNFTSPSHTYAAPGIYTVTHIVNRGFCRDTADAPTTIFQRPILSSVNTNVACNGAANGIIDLTAGGTPPFTYNWNGGITTEDRSGLAPGTYTVTVTDPNACTTTASATITQPNALTITNTNTNVSCNGGSNGAINLTVVGGTPSFSYNWGGGITAQNRTGLTGGTYNITVTDANACTSTRSISVYQPNAVSIVAAGSNLSCSGINNGAITLTVTGGTGAYTYNWGGGVTTQNRTSLAAGTYNVTVNDANACSASASATLTQPSPIALSFNTTDVSCFGGNNGSIITANTTGGTQPYSYIWNDGNTNSNRSLLVAGTYFVTITDQNACTVSGSASINQPPTAVNVTVNSTSVIACYGANTGTINITASGGIPSYTFLWSDNSALEDRTNMLGGTYFVVATDQMGCTATTSATINQPLSPLTIDTVVATDVACFGAATGSLITTVSGGTSPYSYMWTDGATTANRTNILAGNYDLTVTDANGCSTSVSNTITQPSAAVSATTSVTNVLCFGGSNGAISLNPTGGVSPYSFNWGGGITTQNRTGLTAGTYNVVITDSNSCTASVSRTITQPAAALNAVTVVTQVACFGNSTGAINLTVSGGTTAYAYNWGGGITTQNRTNIPAGTYNVTVTDANACSVSASAVVTQPTSSVAVTISSTTNVSCFGGSNGAINISASGGTTAYSYNWGGGVTTQNRTNIPAGTYNVTVTDANACSISTSATITQPTAALNATTSVTNVACFGNSTGAISLTVTGGTTGYSFNWGGGITTQNRTNLTAGTYNVTVTDANTCSVSASATVTQPASALSTSTTVLNVACFGNSTGAINLTVNGGTTAYSYNWGGGVTTQNRTNIPAGTYNVTIIDANSCSATASATLTQPAAALSVVVASTANVSCFGGNNGAINISASGGTTAYSYNWGGGVTTQNRTNIPAGAYNVTVTDANACSANTSASITQPVAALLASVTSTSQVSCFGGNNGAINVAANGGTTAYSFNWGGGVTTQSRTSLTAGTYSVTVTDANACSAITSATITQPVAALIATTTVTNVSCFSGSNGTINTTATGGTLPYVYNWGGSITTPNRTGLTAGTYIVTVTDANACSASVSSSVTQPTAFTTSVIANNVTCNGATNGSINLTVTGATPAYTFMWSNGATTEDLSNLAIGNYSVTVRDANNCSASASASIVQPSNMVISENHTSITCNGSNNGIINISVIGGIPPYSYIWNDGFAFQNRSNLSAGTYSVTVSDSNSCAIYGPIVITEPAVLVATLTATAASCNGSSTGRITSVVSGGTLNYNYVWNNNINTANQNNIPAGTYTLTVTDANACSTVRNATITQPTALSFTSSTVDVTCNSASTGTISITTIGGTPSYSYLWNSGNVTEDRTNLTAGNYSVTITDAQNCSLASNFSITQPAAIQVTLSAQNPTCHNFTNGSINATVIGGVSPMSYLWSNATTAEDPQGVGAGVHAVRVTDNNGCSTTASIQVTMPDALVLNETHTNQSCKDSTNADIKLTVTGGTGAYQYAWSNSSNASSLFDIPVGTYNVSVTDANGCSAALSAIAITEPEQLILQVTITDVACIGTAAGKMEAATTGGTPPYLYQWSNSLTTEYVVNVPAGAYTLTVTDVNGCKISKGAVVNTLPQLSVTGVSDSLPCQNALGGIDLTVTSGAAPYTYQWSNGAVTQDLANINPGMYSVVVKDLNGCPYDTTFIVTNLNSFTVNATGGGTIKLGDTINLQATSTGSAMTTYNWTPAFGMNCPSCQSIVVQP